MITPSKVIKEHVTHDGVVIRVLENKFFDDQKKFWDVVIYQNKIQLDKGSYTDCIVFDRASKREAMELFLAIKMNTYSVKQRS